MVDALVLDLPFAGRWQARNSPARRVPSHGTWAFGVGHAIDFVAVDDHDRSAPRSWRSVLWHEPPERFVGFGLPILAPVAGTVVIVHDGEPDHVARRSWFARIRYALGQARRVRAGVASIAGNHVVIALGAEGPFVLLAHLRRGTVRVAVGDVVSIGDQVAACGNSGNSTEPHVHVQATDTTNWETASSVPIAFQRSRDPRADQTWMPREHEVVLGHEPGSR